MSGPDIAKPVRGIIDISGTASDANGIDFVSLSFDNGASCVKATGSDAWHYLLDTRILRDGLTRSPSSPWTRTARLVSRRA
jgi:hypothetical protein